MKYASGEASHLQWVGTFSELKGEWLEILHNIVREPVAVCCRTKPWEDPQG